MRLLIEKLSTLWPNSLIAEFNSVFGTENTVRLITVFGGVELKVPSQEDIKKMLRDVSIYNQLVTTKDKAEFKIVRRTIQAHHGMKKAKVIEIFKDMKKMFKRSEESEAISQAVKSLKKPNRRKR